ncbi:hypothetical protein [Frankia sp. AgW1.1]|uniref:hypothetical protein n=1 Tax=Frankia sp. AgW1.1 TaxID=1836971 RepID=UPI001933CED4|nr:hypothetical protein [Frankia sp. AgW1.1]MBL7487106.1 hypothetical protein [Frankia sp. AgW1.1]
MTVGLLLGACESCGLPVRTGQRIEFQILRAGRLRRWCWWHRDCGDLDDHRNG